MRDRRLSRLLWLLRAGSVLAVLMAAMFGLTMATFATDDPAASRSLAAAIGLAVFAVLALPALWLPLWAIRRVRERGASGLLPAALFAVSLSAFAFPVGLIPGVAILALIRDLRVRPP